MAHRGKHQVLWGAAVVLVAATGVDFSHAAPIPGFVESWTGTGTNSWISGSGLTNPGTGGTGGAGDGFLRMFVTSPGNLGAYSPSLNYAGDWIAAGVMGISLWLNDVGTDDLLEIHFSIGTPQNFWQYNEGFSPPNNQWRQFVIDLTNESEWTRIRGSGTFQDALRGADRIHVRHDLSPFTGSPNTIIGDFGMDQLSLHDETVDVVPTSWGRIKAIYR